MTATKASANPYRQITWIPTGLSSLDRILGGGIPQRRITEISGTWSVGKSTLAQQIVAEAQKLGKDCLWCDSEFQFTNEYAESLGVDCNKLDLLIEKVAEDTLDYIEEWAEEHKEALIVLDSIGHLLPRAEFEKSADGRVIGGQAKLIATFCRKIVPILAINNNALIVLNHNFTDIMSGKIKTSGGEKLAYSKSIWLMLRPMNKRVMKGDNQVGAVIEAEVRKTRLSATQKQKTEITLLFGEGFSQAADRFQELLDKGEITKNGSTYWLGDQKLGVGLNRAREALKTA